MLIFFTVNNKNATQKDSRGSVGFSYYLIPYPNQYGFLKLQDYIFY